MPTRTRSFGFWWRSRLLVLWRGWQNLRAPGLRRWPGAAEANDARTGAALANAPVLAELRTPLWSDGRDDEFALIAGKVHNLRIAARAFDGVAVPAGQCLSFWQQVGRPVARRGYVLGREVRAGCVIPAIAGGICQLSNALATLAVRAGFELVERHAHSARIEQAASRAGHTDATVFWNYVDLRIRAAVDWRLDVALTADELVLTMRAAHVPHGDMDVDANADISANAGKNRNASGAACSSIEKTKTQTETGTCAHAPAPVGTTASARPVFPIRLAAEVSSGVLFDAPPRTPSGVPTQAPSDTPSRPPFASPDAAPRALPARADATIHATTHAPSPPPIARGCLTCEEWDCHLHRPQLRGQHAREAWLLDGWTPEFEAWLRARPREADRFVSASPAWPVWLPGARATRRWLALPLDGRAQLTPCPATGLRRACWQRLWANHAGRRQASVLTGQRWLARAYARRLRPEHTDLVIDQGLLPHLHQLGALGGRRYAVLARAWPMNEIERRLDRARGHAARKPDALREAKANETGDATLSDFRAAPALIAAETAAMQRANRIVTAHAAVAEYWRTRGLTVEQLPWQRPQTPAMPPRMTAPPAQPASARSPTTLIVFPASALARKGIHELARALSTLPGFSARLRILGSPPADRATLRNLAVEYGHYGDDWVAHADLVVLPAHVEHNPRALLMAVAAGLPVIATPACGLTKADGVTLVPAGDVTALREAIASITGFSAANGAQ